MYESIDPDWSQNRPGRDPQPQSGRGGKRPPPIKKDRGRYYYGMRLASRPRRLLTGLITYGPAFWAWWYFDGFLSEDNDNFTQITGAVMIFGAFFYFFFYAPQHEGQNYGARKWFGTRVVSVRQDQAGHVRVFYPTTLQIFTRSVMILFIDAYWGWLAMLFSKSNRTFADMVAKTVVIREGQITPELPYDKPRRAWGD